MRLRNLALTCLAAMTFAIGACGASDAPPGGSPTSSTPSPEGDPNAVAPRDYLTDVCGAMTAWLDELRALNADLNDLQPDSVQDLKDTTLGYFDGVVAATDTLIGDVEGAGVPDVDGGEATSAAILGALGQTRDALRDARDRVADLATVDPQVFSADLAEIGTEMGASLSEVADALGQFESPELDAAATDIPDCQTLEAA